MPNKEIYLDHAAATPMDNAVIDVMKPYWQERFYNPSATYLVAKQVAKDVKNARARVAHWLGAKPAEIIFTAGGTEANNLAIQGVLKRFPAANIVVSAVEHESVLAPAGQYNRRVVPVKPDGMVDVEKLIALIDEQTVLVSVMYVNNEVGTIQPLRQIAKILQGIREKRRKNGNELPLYFHTDACQAGAYLSLQVHRLGVDLMTINGGKIYGPKQSGALFVASHVELESQILGGGQERDIRSGTENIAGIIGFAAALDIVQSRRQVETTRLGDLQKLFMSSIEQKIPKASVNGSLKSRVPNNVHITIPGQDNERLMMLLDEAGIRCGLGSACSASQEEPSHVLKAIGLSDADARASLRFTMGRSTNERAIKQTVEILASISG